MHVGVIKWKKFSDEQLREILDKNTTFKGALHDLGYNTQSNNNKIIKTIAKYLNYDLSNYLCGKDKNYYIRKVYGELTIIEIDEEAKKREAFLKENRFSTTLDSVLTVLENHGYDYKGYLIPILKYTAKYCKMQEKSESYANWCKTREQGLTERATNKTIFDEFANKRKIL